MGAVLPVLETASSAEPQDEQRPKRSAIGDLVEVRDFYQKARMQKLVRSKDGP